MNYRKSDLRRDVERLLDDMARDLERKASCDNCDDDDVSISGKSNVASDYAGQIANLVASKVGLK